LRLPLTGKLGWSTHATPLHEWSTQAARLVAILYDSISYAARHFPARPKIVRARRSNPRSIHAVEGFFATLTRRRLKVACSVVSPRSREGPRRRSLCTARRCREPHRELVAVAGSMTCD